MHHSNDKVVRFPYVICILVMLLLTWVNVSGHFAQQSFYDVLPDFAKKMSQAVLSWKHGNHSRARDTFHIARELISDHMPTPMDGYGWNWCRALKTYALVLARLVQIESVVDQRDSSTVQWMKDQVSEWANVLTQQAMEWKAVAVTNEAEEQTRIVWLNRFAQAIRQVRSVCAPSS